MGYTEVTVIVDGALSEERTFEDVGESNLMELFIDGWKQSKWDIDETTVEIYKLHHDHEPMGNDSSLEGVDPYPNENECMCIQYLTDHTPYWSNHENS